MVQFQKLSTVLIWSDNFRALADWYQNVLGLKPIEELSHPQDTGVLFEVAPGSTWIWIGQHSLVEGQNKDPHRHMFNLNVDSVQQAYNELSAQGVTFFAPPFKAPTMEKYFATFADPDGNFLQLIGPA